MFGFVLCWLCVALACDVIVIDVDWVLVLFEIGAGSCRIWCWLVLVVFVFFVVCDVGFVWSCLALFSVGLGWYWCWLVVCLDMFGGGCLGCGWCGCD